MDRKETTFDSKFKEQEKNLRNSVQQEQATFAKLKSATQSRLNLREGETKRLQQKIDTQMDRIKALEKELIVEQHAGSSKEKENQTLKAEKAALQDTLDSERGAADSLRQVLEETLDALKQKDDESTKNIAKVKSSIDEIRRRHNEELDGVQNNLNKVREERDILQKKLSDFFMKVSALPESLQQQFFCSEQVDEVGFADVLSSYMDE